MLREGFVRTLAFSWNDLTIENAAQVSFWADALVGPHGWSIPVVNKQGRALFSFALTV
jgi:hypothetical protein